MDSLRFTIPEILSLIGVAQCAYILSYMAFRSGNVKSAALPFLYFLVLGAAFALDFAVHYVAPLIPRHETWQWALWFAGPPLSVLLILQVMTPLRLPGWKALPVLTLLPLAWVGSYAAAAYTGGCPDGIENCVLFQEWLAIGGLLAGVVSMGSVWLIRHPLRALARDKAGRDRYWLILALVMMNLQFLGVVLLGAGGVLAPETVILLRNAIGLGVVYIAGTSLFRIYPQAVQLVRRAERREGLNPQEKGIAGQIEALLERDKIYHEAAYDRAELARELKIPETVVSRVINLHFGKSLPQLLNERRVADAKRLLQETDAAVKVIADEVGFNSLASFNRVFKEMTGMAPSAFRNAQPDKLSAKK